MGRRPPPSQPLWPHPCLGHYPLAVPFMMQKTSQTFMDMSQIAFWDDDSTPTLLQGIAYGVSNFIKQAPTITWRTRVGAIDK